MINDKNKRKKFILFIAMTAVAMLICLIMWQSAEDLDDVLSVLELFLFLEVLVICASFVIFLRIDRE